MPDRLKNILIGLFVIGAIAITISLILFLEPTIGDGKKTMYVRFTNISGVSLGTRVTFAGRPVGEVTAIKEVAHAREEPYDELGRVYFYQLTLKVDSSVEVFSTDEIAVRTTGLLGEKSVAIIPKAPPKGIVPKLITNQVVYGESVDPLTNALNQFSQLSEKVEIAVGDFNEWFVENTEDLSSAVKYFASSMDELDQILHTANEKNLVASISESIDIFTDDLKLVRQTLQEVQENDFVGKATVAVDNFAEAGKVFNTEGREIMNNISLITQDIADGSGTLGKIIKSDDLYLRFVAVMSKVDTLMNDVNHYGILFQYDKHWQRLRTKRANLMEALATPAEFRNYFESEVDTITTSLARISILLETAEEPEEKQKIMDSESFKRDFATLFRQVKDLMDSLKLYNEQLVENLQASDD